MSEKTPREVLNELEEVRKTLSELLTVDDPRILLYLDLNYFASKVSDLKQDLRIAEARE